MRLTIPVLLLASTVAVTAQKGPAPAASTHLPADVLALACAPTLVYDTPAVPLRITGGQDSFVRQTFHPGDLITINAGTDHGIEVGQEFFARRVVPDTAISPVNRRRPATIRTAGWIKVYAVDRQMSLATISHVCDTIDVGDYLEPFILPQVPTVAADRPAAQRDNYGEVMVGGNRRRAFGKNEFFIVNRGAEHGVTVGAHFVIYRNNRKEGNFLYELGEAVAVDVRADSSTLLATVTRDAFLAGDLVALRK
ncbi:MAG: hypothetical protein FJW14_11130 [Acidimicrobiia bacterium]|nr:hypothetical protein [Acidimicrobiia bacterium]